MIVAIAGTGQGYGIKAFSGYFAALRAQHGRKVLLIRNPPADDQPSTEMRGVVMHSCAGRSLQSDLEHLYPRFDDVLIESGGNAQLAEKTALIAARMAIVPIDADHVDLRHDYRLVASLNAARMFNPGLHVTFVLVGSATRPVTRDMSDVHAYVAHVMAAKLASTVLHVALDAEGRLTSDQMDKTEIQALYREIFSH